MKKIFIILLFLSHFVTGQFLPNTKQIVGTKEDIVNKSISKTLGTSDILYPSQKAVKSYVDSLSILAQNGFQAGLNTKLNISQAISFAYPKGFYNVSANTPPLSATPDGSFEQGAFYEINNSGTIGFSGSNFSSGQVLNVGDKLVKIGTQWGYMPYPETSRLKNIEAVVSNYSVLGSAVITNGSYQNSAGTVVTSASRSYTTFTVGNDLIKVSTVVNGGIPVAIFKNSSGTVISTQGTGVNGSDLAFTNYYLNIPAGTVTVVINGNVASPTVVYKGSVFDQSAQKSVVDALSSNVSSLSTSVSNNTNALSGFINQTITKNDGYWINSSGTSTASPSRTYATFSGANGDNVIVTTTINGNGIPIAVYKNGSTVLGSQGAGINGRDTTFTNYSLSIPAGTNSIIVNGNVVAPLTVKKYSLISKAASTSTTDSLKVRISNGETLVSNYSSILSDYATQSVSVTQGSFIDYSGTVTTSSPRSYTSLSATPSDKIKVTTSLNGSAMYLALFMNSNGIVISRVAQGTDNVTTNYNDYLLTIPEGTTIIKVNGMVANPIIVKKLTLFNKAVSTSTTDSLKVRISNGETLVSNYSSILSDYATQSVSVTQGSFIDYSGAVTTSSPRSYTSFSATPSDKIKVTTSLNGSAMYLALFFDNNGNQLNRISQGVDGVTTNYTDYLLTIPNGTTNIKVNGMVASPIVIKKLTLYNKAVSYATTDSLKTRLNAYETQLNAQKSILTDYVKQNVTFTNGSYFSSTGTIVSSSSRKFTSIAVNSSDAYKVTTTINGGPVYLVVYVNSGGTVLGTQVQGTNGVNSTYTDFALTIPATTAYAYINGNLNDSLIVKKTQLISQFAQKSDITDLKNYVDNSNPSGWKGKTIFWLGTSIPEGGLYPTNSAVNLGATAINKAVGSSMVRISRADGTINSLAWQNVCYSLSHTIAEKQDLIDNWATYRLILSNNPPTTLDATEQAKILSCSYENRLLPYLNGTFPMPDLFVFDHGRNDNLSSDTDTQYTTVPSVRNDRRYYMGAMNYLIDLIYQYNPYARIAFVGHYENWDFSRVSVGQQNLANYWQLPILKTWEHTGFSQNIVVGSHTLWSVAPWSNYIPSGQNTALDMNMRRVMLPDYIHPSSATNGKPQALLTAIITNWLKTLP
ncbi:MULTISPECIES: hypothetical protein [unclassified Arcicella]|uniref:beta strand repeat-containing protein n=1 Tax=unclassified Arcicella TaxID=2644986 RepID=UPI002860E381|nr:MULTISPECIES: hypothetical protein [unclassified Arcicella]MDR6564966.1 hypothetical protein [Arcicella sp. BE51]MDR6814756.1 hypothetical protein [Arcicella sp. BE140]MDR6826202.1 hypothetical protein [Arcicella sp. BE139]